MWLQILIPVLVALEACADERTFKPFNASDLEKYKLATEVEKSDLKINVAAPKVPKEDLATLEALCVNRCLFYALVTTVFNGQNLI
jgi:hypothetical protein